MRLLGPAESIPHGQQGQRSRDWDRESTLRYNVIPEQKQHSDGSVNRQKGHCQESNPQEGRIGARADLRAGRQSSDSEEEILSDGTTEGETTYLVEEQDARTWVSPRAVRAGKDRGAAPHPAGVPRTERSP